MAKPEGEISSGLSRSAPAERPVTVSAARVVWDAILISAGLFAAASATFALIVAAKLPFQEAILVGAATCAAVSLMTGAAVAICRAAAARGEAAREVAEGRLEAMERVSADALVLCRRDSRRTVMAATERLETVSGFPRDRFLSGVTALSDLVEPADADAVGERIAAALARGPEYRVTYGLRHLSGHVKQVEETGRLVPPGGDEVIAALRDVGEKPAWERAARQMQRELRILRDRSPFGIVYFDGRGSVRGLNGAAARLLGTTPGDKTPRSLFDLLQPEDVAWSPESLSHFVSPAGVVMVAANTHARLQVWLIPASAGDAASRAYAGFLVAAPTHTAAEPKLTLHPFAAALGAEFGRARRFGSVFSVIAVSAAWRDEHGQPVEADAQLFASLADCCRGRARGVDTLAGVRGGVLAVLLPEAGSRTARLVGERLRRAVLEIVVARESELLHAVPSIGAARLKTEDAEAEAILQRALDAATRAGERGGNQVVVAS